MNLAEVLIAAFGKLKITKFELAKSIVHTSFVLLMISMIMPPYLNHLSETVPENFLLSTALPIIFVIYWALLVQRGW